MNHVMDKDGNRVTSFVYDDWNEYVVSWLLARYGLSKSYNLKSSFTPVLSEDFKKTECKYEPLYRALNTYYSEDSDDSDDSSDGLDFYAIEMAITYDTHCIWRNMVNSPTYSDDKKSIESILTLTEGFENNPIKAFIRVHYCYRTPKLFQQVLDIYWIYFFSCFCNDRIDIPESKIDIKKAREYLREFDMDEAGEYKQIYKLIDCAEYKETYYKKEIERLKEEHQKEIEELLSPDGAGYKVIKERFEKMQSDTELN